MRLYDLKRARLTIPHVTEPHLSALLHPPGVQACRERMFDRLQWRGVCVTRALLLQCVAACNAHCLCRRRLGALIHAPLCVCGVFGLPLHLHCAPCS